jgi:cyclophilin family peptidyl-prolyl cis-trans isomerase
MGKGLRSRHPQHKLQEVGSLMSKQVLSSLGAAIALAAVLSACAQSADTPIATPVPKRNAPLQWSDPPEMAIDPQKRYVATLKTAKGDIKVELLADKAPRTVNNFVFLARQGYYDGTTFHRVLHDFMAQGGDPTGTGAGGPGYRFKDEIHPDLKFDCAGIVAMANAGAATNGSQFFITFKATPWLDGGYSIFGRVIDGIDVVLSLRLRDPQERPTYQGDLLERVEIEELD